jgi:hypothetical protein
MVEEAEKTDEERLYDPENDIDYGKDPSDEELVVDSEEGGERK